MLIRTEFSPASTRRRSTAGRDPLVLMWMVAWGQADRMRRVASTRAAPRVNGSPSHPWPKLTKFALPALRCQAASSAISVAVGANRRRVWGEATSPHCSEMQPRQAALHAGETGIAPSPRRRKTFCAVRHR